MSKGNVKAMNKRRNDVSSYKNKYNRDDILKELSRFELKGNVIDQGWFEHIKNDKGKVQPNAIFVLSEIVYWYRPTLIFDETSGNIKGLKPKFKGDMLQKNYKQLSEKFGLTERQVSDACKLLEEKKLIILDFRTVTLPNGRKLNNVLYIGLNVEELKKISILMNDTLEIIEDIKDNIEKEEEEPESIGNKGIDDPVTKKRDSLLRKNVTPYYGKTGQAVTKKRNTYTESTYTESTYKDIKNKKNNIYNSDSQKMLAMKLKKHRLNENEIRNTLNECNDLNLLEFHVADVDYQINSMVEMITEGHSFVNGGFARYFAIGLFGRTENRRMSDSVRFEQDLIEQAEELKKNSRDTSIYYNWLEE